MSDKEKTRADRSAKPQHCGVDMAKISRLKVRSVEADRALTKLGHEWVCNQCGHTE